MPRAGSGQGGSEDAAGAVSPVIVRGALSNNMLTVLIGNAFPAFVALLTGPILAQSLAVEGRGAVAAATAPLVLITSVVTFGIPEAVTFLIARTPRLARRIAARAALILTVAGVIATGLVVLASPTLSAGDNSIRRLMLFASLAAVPTLMVSVLRGVASASGHWRTVTLERISSSSLRLVALVPFWLTNTLTPAVATAVIAAMPVAGGVVYIGLLRRLPRTGDAGPPEAQVPGLLRYGTRIWAGSIAGVILMRVDQTIMTPLAGARELGLYVVAVSVGELPMIINSAVRDVTFVSEATSSLDSRLAASARISATICLLTALFIGVTMLWWFPLLFGDEFRGALPVAGIMLVAIVLGTPGSVGGTALGARGRPGLRSWSLFAACLVNIGLLFLLLPRFGAVGAALATLVGNLVSSNLNLYFLSRCFGFRISQFYGVRRSDITVLRRNVARLGRTVLRRG